jgi:glycosyltransferase involved in cell wall biosynthesis
MDQIAESTDGVVDALAISSPSESEQQWAEGETDLARSSEKRFVRTRWPGSPAKIQISLVIPAMNEEHNIGWVLERLPAEIDEVILVDGNSVDNTVAVSRAIRPDIRVIGQDRPGKGAALRAGFAAARGDVIVMIDADRSMDPLEIKRFLGLIEEGYDLVKGSRFMGDGGTTDMEAIRRCGNAALRGLANSLYGTRFSDLCYGYMAFRRSALAQLALASDGFEIETEIIVRAIKTGLRVGEVASFEQPRAHGESNLNTWRDGTRVLRTMLRHRFARRPRQALEPVPLVVAAESSAAGTDISTIVDIAV